MKKLFSTILVICSLLGGNAYGEDKKIDMTLDISTSNAENYLIYLFEGGRCDFARYMKYHDYECNWVKDGNKVFINLNNSNWILTGTLNWFGKIRGTWTSKSTETSTGTFWGKKINE